MTGYSDPSVDTGFLRDSLRRIRDRIAETAISAGRKVDEITLLAVTKRKSPNLVREAISLGLTLFGENYVQEAVDKRAAIELSGAVGAEWHLIGHLQSNKARIAVETFALIQSLDSEKVGATIARLASERGQVQRVLVQVHLGEEATKTGISPEKAIDLASTIATLPGLVLEGLMGIAPNGTDPAPHFQRLRNLYDQLPAANRKILSMGMSSDYPTAIAEGSTMVRIGSDLFGRRP